MSFMWRPETFHVPARPIAVALSAVNRDARDQWLRARVWAVLIAANLATWAAGLWLAATLVG